MKTPARPDAAQPKMLNDAPGFLCPVCQSVRIKVALESFLTQAAVVCPSCNQSFTMDKSNCGPILEALQTLYTAQKNMQLLSERKL